MAQRWDAARYGKNARFVADLAGPLVGLLAPKPGEHILDLGCGDGVLSAEIRARGATIIGIDASSEMVAAARERGIDARIMRGEAIAFAGVFDAVFSNAALHWMHDLPAVFTGVARALKPGGRFVAEMGGEGNVATVIAALEYTLGRHGFSLPPPWIFPSAGAIVALLSRQGFGIEKLELTERPTRLPGDLADWLQTFAGDYLGAVPVAERDGLIEEVRSELFPVLHSASGWTLDYVRLRFSARMAPGMQAVLVRQRVTDAMTCMPPARPRRRAQALLAAVTVAAGRADRGEAGPFACFAAAHAAGYARCWYTPRGWFVAAVIAMLATPGTARADAMDAALLQGLDKVTARISTLEAPVGQPVRFGTLEIVVRHCDKTPPEEQPEAAAFLQIFEIKRGEPTELLFSGWMFASSPALSALEHPVYDVVVVDCIAKSTAPAQRSSAVKPE